MDKKFKTEHIDVNGIRIHIRTAGPPNGQLVFLLHGFPEDSFAWHHQMQYLSENGYFVIAPDQRGYYTSSKPELIKDYQLNKLCGDITALIRFFQRKKAVIIGHDWGGIVGWYMASVQPQYIEKLIILNIPHPAAFMKIARIYPPQWLRSAYILFFQLPYLPEKLLEMNQYQLLKKLMSSTARPGTFTEKSLNRYEQSWKAGGTVRGMLNWYRMMRYQPIWKMPDPDPGVPVRIIWGKNDAALSFITAKESLKKCQDGQLILLDEGTHWLHHEYPEIVNRWLLRFLKETKPSSCPEL